MWTLLWSRETKVESRADREWIESDLVTTSLPAESSHPIQNGSLFVWNLWVHIFAIVSILHLSLVSAVFYHFPLFCAFNFLELAVFSFVD